MVNGCVRLAEKSLLSNTRLPLLVVLHLADGRRELLCTYFIFVFLLFTYEQTIEGICFNLTSDFGLVLRDLCYCCSGGCSMCACLDNCVALNLRVLLISIVSEEREKYSERERGERETKKRIRSFPFSLSLSFHLDLGITCSSSRHRPLSLSRSLSLRLRNSTNPISLNVDIISFKKRSRLVYLRHRLTVAQEGERKRRINCRSLNTSSALGLMTNFRWFSVEKDFLIN